MSNTPREPRTTTGVEPLEAAIDALESLIDQTAQAAGEAHLPVLNDAVDDADDVFGDDDADDGADAPEAGARERIAAIVGELETLVTEGLPQVARTGAPPTAMDKTYEPQAIESRWYQRWEAEGLFRAQGDGAPYCIMLPPPNVTGSLHMGHAFNNTIMDGLIRHHRMLGRRTLWQCGTDHAGIATQMVVERQLAQQHVSRHDLGREGFVARVWEWKEQSGSTITRQLRRLGTSMDWDRERFTLDEGLSRAVTEVFVRLHEDGLVYRGQRLVNWDPVLHTAISDLEVVAEEESGHMWHIRYPLADGDGHVVVATTRPETMLGDSAVAVHPEDGRYSALVGRQLVLPLTGRTIPVIADEYVDPAFGSGCVKITPAHDFNDYTVWQRHREQPAFTAQPHGGLINILTPDAALDATVPQAYRGLDRYAARKRIVADLEAAGLLERVQPHKLMVPRGDRSGAVIEPYLTDQWYVRAAPLAAPAIAAVEDGRIRFVPENWSKTYFEWMRNIEDWCISRQLWWGHRIPAWYDPAGNVYVGRDEGEARARSGLPAGLPLRRDEDVLDTWFSSALWPFSTLGWPDRTPELAAFYPTSVLVTGFDIIFFWVARMVMMGMHFMGDVPFREVYVHGLVRDHEGQKMSKSKGNILDPIDLIDGIDLEALIAKRITGLMRPQDAAKIEQSTRRQFPDGIAPHGTDALRYTFASLASLGRNINFDLGRIEGYRNFCNKLWNASRFVLMATEDVAATVAAPCPGVGERWIRSRLQDCIAAVDEGYAQYRFDQIAHAIYEFVWGEYCDWYLEYAKTVLNDADATPGARAATRATLLQVLETVLRLAHPLMPFITEEIWQRVAPLAGRAGPSVSVAPWPALEPDARDPEATAEFHWLRECILGVRRIRAEMDIAPGKPLPLIVSGGTAGERAFLDRNRGALAALARLSGVVCLARDEEAPQAATALAGAMTLLVPLADLIDRNAELERLGKEIERRRQELARVQGKLANAGFVERAPAEVVAKERARLAEVESGIAKLEEQRRRIAAM